MFKLFRYISDFDVIEFDSKSIVMHKKIVLELKTLTKFKLLQRKLHNDIVLIRTSYVFHCYCQSHVIVRQQNTASPQHLSTTFEHNI